jgi:hypothetical protein
MQRPSTPQQAWLDQIRKIDKGSSAGFQQHRVTVELQKMPLTFRKGSDFDHPFRFDTHPVVTSPVQQVFYFAGFYATADSDPRIGGIEDVSENCYICLTSPILSRQNTATFF